LLAEGHLHRRLFGQMLRRIYALPHSDCVTRQQAGLVTRQERVVETLVISLGPALVAN
jgi:hypothetical protein